MTSVLDVADNWLRLRWVTLTVNVDNTRAIKFYEKLGFETEGRLSGDVLRNGDILAPRHAESVCVAKPVFQR